MRLEFCSRLQVPDCLSFCLQTVMGNLQKVSGLCVKFCVVVCMSACVCVCGCVYVGMCVCVVVYVGMCLCVCVCVCVCEEVSVLGISWCRLIVLTVPPQGSSVLSALLCVCVCIFCVSLSGFLCVCVCVCVVVCVGVCVVCFFFFGGSVVGGVVCVSVGVAV